MSHVFEAMGHASWVGARAASVAYGGRKPAGSDESPVELGGRSHATEPGQAHTTFSAD